MNIDPHAIFISVSVAMDPETGNLLGVDNDVTSFLCECLQCGSFYLRINMDNDFEYYSLKKQRIIGGLWELMQGTATFRVGFYGVPQGVLPLTSYTGFAYLSEQGFSIGYPRPVVSLFNAVKVFE